MSRPNSVAVLKTSGSVRIVRTTSTSFMTGTGLKKCMPMNRRCRSALVEVIICVIERLEVFEAKIVSGRQI